jgi:hypothetical protein
MEYIVKPWNKQNPPNTNIENKAIDVEDKKAWCEFGEKLENEFLEKVSKNYRINVARNKIKDDNPYTHDIWTIVPSDLKFIRTPFYKAKDLYGIESRYAITMNDKDVIHYKEYPLFLIVFDILYEDWMEEREIRVATIHQIISLIDENKAKKHILKNRINDTKGNGKANWIFDYRWFSKIFKKQSTK